MPDLQRFRTKRSTKGVSVGISIGFSCLPRFRITLYLMLSNKKAILFNNILF